jgi:GNAT superfamily N-acetyltransferase
MTINLRPATGDDAPVLLAILHAAFEEYRGRLDPPSGAHSETLDTIRYRLTTACGVLAFTGDEPVGCVFYQVESAHLYVSRLSVLPAYRRQGVGRTLIEYVEAQAKVLHVPRVQLNERLALPALRNYYERLGYQFAGYGTHHGYSEPTYVVLEKVV